MLLALAWQGCAEIYCHGKRGEYYNNNKNNYVVINKWKRLLNTQNSLKNEARYKIVSLSIALQEK